MRLYYTASECPFSQSEIEAAFHGTGDVLLLKEQLTIPYIANDPEVPLRYDEFDAYAIDSIVEFLESLPEAQSLGVVLITEKPLLLLVDIDFTSEPGKIEDYYVRGAATEALCVLMSTHGLTPNQSLKAFRQEMGHFYGLPHCEDTPNCLMIRVDYDSTDLWDNIKTDLCPICKTKLETWLMV